MEVSVPEPGDILARIADVQATLNEEQRSIAEWRAVYRRDLATARQRHDIAIFNSFINSLLEQATRGETWRGRANIIQRVFLTLDNVTEANARQVLAEASYRWGPEKGASVIMAAKRLVTEQGFAWTTYIDRAEHRYESNFLEDDFLRIKQVNFKTRDLALSELSEKFVAIDLHIIRVTTRTGLLLYGYGDPRITTDVSRPPGYLFFHGLMLKLARHTGWPGAGYSPGEIDRMFWHFGRTLCRVTPQCEDCPLANICLTRTT